MIFWLVLKLEISSRVLMSILKDFGLFLEDLLGPAGTIALDPTFGSFTLLELVSDLVN